MYAIKNNAYHDAILNRDLATLNELKTCNDDNPNDKINEASWMNTPLLLAVKTGFFEAALHLLEQYSSFIDVNKKDLHGLSALHWACLYKNNAVIERLVSMGANINDNTIVGFTPLDIYMSQWPEKSPSATGFTSNPNDQERQILVPAYRSYDPSFFVIKDRFIYNPKDNFIMFFHDMVFHMDAIVANLGLDEITHFVKFGNRKDPSDQQEYGVQSASVFQENFKRGYPLLREYLNQLSPSNEVFNLLNVQSSSSNELK